MVSNNICNPSGNTCSAMYRMYGIQSILLSSCIWRKSVNELFFFIIGVSGVDYRSKGPVCVCAVTHAHIGEVRVYVCLADLMIVVVPFLVSDWRVLQQTGAPNDVG